MRHRQFFPWIFSSMVTLSLLLSGLAFGQAGYDEDTLRVKQRFADDELAALAAPYFWISGDGTLV